MNNYKKYIQLSKKGISKIEALCVMIVIAVIIAIALPIMINAVSDAEEKAAMAQARNVLLAAQAIATEASAHPSDLWEEGNVTLKFGKKYKTQMDDIMELSGIKEKIILKNGIRFKKWKVDYFTYQSEKINLVYEQNRGFTAL